MPSASRFASTIRKLEDLPSDGGQAVDALSSGVLEQALAKITSRVAALEGIGSD